MLNPVFLSVLNFKGGVGKTTTAITLARGFAKKKYKTLVLDLDHQGNATSGLGVDKNDEIFTLLELHDEVIKKKKSFEEVFPLMITEVEENLWLLGGNVKIHAANNALTGESVARERQLSRLFSKLAGFDLCVIDCHADSSEITTNIMMLADYLLIPLTLDQWGYDGLSDVLTRLANYRELLGEDAMKIKILGFLPTKVKFTTVSGVKKDVLLVAQGVRQALEEQFPGKMLPDIRFSADIEKAQVNQQTIFDYEDFKFKSNAAKDYWTLVEEIEKVLFLKGAKKNGNQKVK
ncbi:MAG: ParA family protein [Pyrinomonadaceae bacterium]|nr:ParA family protein [Pyrinomonadaceae bacterium]